MEEEVGSIHKHENIQNNAIKCNPFLWYYIFIGATISSFENIKRSIISQFYYLFIIYAYKYNK